MPDLRRISILACVLLVALRLSIGWQFLYEGLWKLNTLGTSQPWSSEGYLKNAEGPLRDTFRGMTGDPDDLAWLDYDKTAARWDGWVRRFQSHYSDLSERQQRELAVLVEGQDKFSAELPRLPEGVEFRGSLGHVKYDASRKLLWVDAENRITPRERESLLNLVDLEAASEEQVPVIHEYRNAVGKLYDRGARLSLKDRLKVLLKADPERAGAVIERDGEVIEERIGEIELYKQALKRYEQRRRQAGQDFEWQHLERMRDELQQLRARLVGPVKALDTELRTEAYRLLTPEQRARGPVPEARSKVDQIDTMTMWSLTIIGVLLLAGLFSRLAAVAGAGLLMLFYLAMPPWPGVPEAPGVEHSLIVNKNFIEAVALLALAALPTGQWFGVDALLLRLNPWRRRYPDERAASESRR